MFAIVEHATRGRIAASLEAADHVLCLCIRFLARLSAELNEQPAAALRQLAQGLVRDTDVTDIRDQPIVHSLEADGPVFEDGRNIVCS